MKLITLVLMFVALTAIKVSACGNGECEPTPEPEPPSEPSVRSSDRDPLPQSRYLPCCVKDGVVVARKQLFTKLSRTQAYCDSIFVENNSDLMSCPNIVEKALK